MTKQMQALKASIEHWEENIILVQEKKLPLVESSDCALCNFNKRDYHWCVGCIIPYYSGSKNCKGTPYVMIEDILLNGNDDYMPFVDDWKNLLQACLLELDFLMNIYYAEKNFQNKTK